MVYTLEELKSDVLARLGEIARPLPSSLIASGPAEVIATKAESMLPEIGARLIMEAPAEALGDGYEMEAEVGMRMMPCGLYASEMQLPEGFLRPVSFKMSSWKRSVSRIVSTESAEWECQWSAESGIAGCPERPRLYMERSLLRALGSKTEEDTLSHFNYWAIPMADANGEFRFPKNLYPDLVGFISKNLAIS